MPCSTREVAAGWRGRTTISSSTFIAAAARQKSAGLGTGLPRRLRNATAPSATWMNTSSFSGDRGAWGMPVITACAAARASRATSSAAGEASAARR